MQKPQLPPDLLQLIYAVIVIILIPIALAFNTLYLLHGVQRDMDYELNNKALMVGSAVSHQLSSLITDQAQLSIRIQQLIKDPNLSDIRAIEAFTSQNQNLVSLASTSPLTQNVTDPVLNQLAWGSNTAYSKQITARLGSGDAERVWLVALPITDQSNKKVGLLNVYVSAASIDQITTRTSHDSLFILIGTIIVVLLLLLNHFRFFEVSVLFERLREVDKLKDDFISMASHELKAPLTAIGGYAYLLQREPAIQQNAKAAKQTDVIIRSANRLQELINDMLDVSRIEQNRMQFDLQPCNLSELLDQVIAEFANQAEQKQLQLHYDKPDQPVFIVADQAKLHQVLANLVSNAIKYTPQGSVTINHDIQANHILTKVIDTGVGIPADQRSKLFAKFSRIPNDQTKDVPGTGLGLWITKQIIEKMNGQITVESIAGQGTQFIITLPKSNQESMKPTEQTQSPPHQSPAESITTTPPEPTPNGND